MLGLRLWMLPLSAGFVATVVLAIVVITGPSTESPPSAAANTPSDTSAPAEEPAVGASTAAANPAPDSLVAETPISSIVTPPGGTSAPDFVGIDRWLNSPPLSMEELRGKVVLIDFWTYSCINCERTLPYVRNWHEKYSDRGLVVVGVHSPEFEFEKDLDNVKEAIVRLGVSWPVATDNQFRTWRSYENRWWPHKFLIDQDGQIRYHHIGEGAYEETELHIRNLLEEANSDVSDIPLAGVLTLNQ